MVRAFVERRSQSVTGVEPTHLPVTKAVVWNIHSGGSVRGLTWHDEVVDVVWLLGVSTHGKPREDAYQVLKARDRSGDLMPTMQDYLDLECTREIEPFVAQVHSTMRELLTKARMQPEVEFVGSIAGLVDVSVVVQAVSDDTGFLAEIWLAIAHPPRKGVPNDWIAVLLAACVSDNDGEPMATHQFPRQGGLQANEIGFCWLDQH
jgi:hypothetical protein